VIAVFYGVYTAIRDLRGTRPVSVAQAFHNAQRVIGLERTLGVFHEAQVQHWLLGDRFAIEILNDWYASTHFVVTAAVLVTLYLVHPVRYRRWRNALAAATALALIGFAWFPLMPPRLLPAGYGFTDTLRVVGGLWNFNSGPMTHLSDDYAAMPSLHFAWALWCGLALFAMSRRWWLRVLALCYPAVTLVCVIVTANHYFTDTAAGALIVAVGYGAGRAVGAARPRRIARMAS
jgi:membrane-associated phospholipid phosphatase